MVGKLLNIRLKQLLRASSELGIFRVIFILALAVYGMFALLIKLEESSYNELILGAFIFIILSIHTKRKDKDFLKLFIKTPILIFAIDYFILSIPLLFLFLYFQLWIYSAILLSSIAIISLINIKINHKNFNTGLQRLVSNDNFEWKAGFRKNFILLVLVWTLGIATSFFIGSVIIAMFIIGIMIMSFYERNESLNMLLALELKPKLFLLKKIGSHINSYTVLSLPLILSFLVFHHEYFYIPLIIYFVFAILIAYNILLKYAFYSPYRESNGTQVFSAIGSISVFLPFMLIVVLVLGTKFYFQAINNLKFYLNDFN